MTPDEIGALLHSRGYQWNVGLRVSGFITARASRGYNSKFLGRSRKIPWEFYEATAPTIQDCMTQLLTKVDNPKPRPQ